MKKIFFLFLVSVFSSDGFAQIYLARACEITFFSKSIIENIEAVNNSAKPVLNTTTNDVVIKVPITGFQFESSMMQNHFNENYMESEQYPFALFKGKINETIDYAQNVCNKVTVTGNLNMHGTEKCIMVIGTLTVKDSLISIEGKFKVRLDDYGIKVPSLYVKNIAEEVEIKIFSELLPYVKE